LTNGHGSTPSWDTITPPTPAQAIPSNVPSDSVDITLTPTDITSYKPKIINREWFLSENDLEWISIGCYILGCGGGGNPETLALAIREMIRGGANVRVIDADDMDKESHAVWGGGIGSPEVGAERLVGGS
jgi:hypothetical protein